MTFDPVRGSGHGLDWKAVHPERGFVVAGVDGPPAEAAVLRVAAVVGEVLEVPVRPVHVVPGPGLRGEAQRSALAGVTRGDRAEIVGRPETLLTSLAQAGGSALTVLGARQRARRPGGRRGAGTAMAVARRVGRPILLAPPAAERWPGPRKVLTALDGTGRTAMAAASALTGLLQPSSDVVALHAADGNPLPVNGRTMRAPRTSLGRRILALVEDLAGDLLVLVWTRRTQGAFGTAVVDVVSATSVPVLLVPLAPAPGV